MAWLLMQDFQRWRCAMNRFRLAMCLLWFAALPVSSAAADWIEGYVSRWDQDSHILTMQHLDPLSGEFQELEFAAPGSDSQNKGFSVNEPVLIYAERDPATLMWHMRAFNRLRDPGGWQLAAGEF